VIEGGANLEAYCTRYALAPRALGLQARVGHGFLRVCQPDLKPRVLVVGAMARIRHSIFWSAKSKVVDALCQAGGDYMDVSDPQTM
jgi:hypothetical protein